MDESVSCIVPVYNGERFICEALESIFRQTLLPAEVLVVDDGSDDGTPDVVASFGERVGYLRQSNSGAPAARNRGILTSRGAFVAFLDADDLWHPEKVERQLRAFRADAELDVSVAHAQNFWESELEEEESFYEGRRRGRPIPAYVSGSMMARRSVFDLVGLFDPELRHGHDVEWFLRGAEKGASVRLEPDVLLYRRMHPDGISRVNAEKSLDAHLGIIKASLDRRRSGRDARTRSPDPESGAGKRSGS